MDRKIEQKKGIRRAFTKKALPFWGGALLLVFILWLIFRDDSKKLRIDADNITVSTVTSGEFNDYIRISGQVAPMTTIQISPLEGGVVQQIVTEEGSRVKAGDVILILSNENLDMQILSSEADLAEKENILRNTMIQMEQQKLSVEQEKLQLQMEVQRNRRTYEAQKSLYDDGLIAREDYLKAEEDFTLSNSRLKLVENRAKQDSLHRSVEIDRMRESLENMRVNMMMIRKRKENLTIKAPIDGELGLLDAPKSGKSTTLTVTKLRLRSMSITSTASRLAWRPPSNGRVSGIRRRLEKCIPRCATASSRPTSSSWSSSPRTSAAARPITSTCNSASPWRRCSSRVAPSTRRRAASGSMCFRPTAARPRAATSRLGDRTRSITRLSKALKLARR